MLEQKGIQAHQLLNDADSIELHRQASHSVAEMLVWTGHILHRAVGYMNEVEQTQTVADRIRRFIDQNLDREISRKEIASQVYLNPDYLDRLFKKETGNSVAGYLLQKRVNKAQELLAMTDLPVSEIATSVGYTNLSNFALMFRKMTGANPSVYRDEAKRAKR